MSKHKVKKRKELNATKRIELEHVLEVLMYEVKDDSPCECGLYCPFYDDTLPNDYCPFDSDCVKGMVKYIEELCEEN